VGFGASVLICTLVPEPGTVAGFQLPAVNQSVEVPPVQIVCAWALPAQR
jgi:hypothetical protein